ncbi:OmpW/AlkL family protein [Bradyrhizobium sp. SBR1B]|uniref:OmpW/AlkL family protein n=1 Tax=Bradyrhizobium sp. SBR1B TaxID=2663836 RepID=UPI0017991BC8|nr:outer membrane protein W [Bradyrhizobium sp. SBR1B]
MDDPLARARRFAGCRRQFGQHSGGSIAFLTCWAFDQRSGRTRAFFHKEPGAELILGVTSHHVSGNGALTGLDIGKAWLLPSTLTLQYHFTDFGVLEPISAQASTTLYSSTTAANTSLAGPAVTDLHIRNQFGVAVQFGFDHMLDSHWGLNFDVKGCGCGRSTQRQ